jgi:hypothetical protein
VPGFNNVAISGSNGSEALKVVDRRNGACYSSFWLIVHACNSDGYAITSFNEWHEGTEIEPSIEYGDQYLNLTRDNTTPIHEFSSIILLPFMIVTLLAVIVYRRKHDKSFPMRYS